VLCFSCFMDNFLVYSFPNRMKSPKFESMFQSGTPCLQRGEGVLQSWGVHIGWFTMNKNSYLPNILGHVLYFTFHLDWPLWRMEPVLKSRTSRSPPIPLEK
jgi:hypothetical protein